MDIGAAFRIVREMSPLLGLPASSGQFEHRSTNIWIREILFLKNQSGFPKYSTDTCLADLTIYGRLVGMVCIDLWKKIDMVDHSILLDKLHFMGFSINWFLSYLSCRASLTLKVPNYSRVCLKLPKRGKM